MDKLIERISLEEIFSILAPGFASLIGLRFILKWEIADFLGKDLSSSSVMTAAAAVVAAYLAGLFLLEWANAGTRFYLSLQLESLARGGNRTGGTARFRIARRGIAIRIPVLLLHGLPLPKMRLSWVAAQVSMSEYIEAESHTFESARLSSPWDRMDLFMKLISRSVTDGNKTMIAAIGGLHSRLLFALSMALTLALMTVLATLKCVAASLVRHEFTGLCALVICAGFASYMLRRIATHYWEMETTLVSSLLEVTSSAAPVLVDYQT